MSAPRTHPAGMLPADRGLAALASLVERLPRAPAAYQALRAHHRAFIVTDAPAGAPSEAGDRHVWMQMSQALWNRLLDLGASRADLDAVVRAFEAPLHVAPPIGSDAR